MESKDINQTAKEDDLDFERYSCVKCRKFIFDTSNLEVDHTSKHKEFKTRPQKKGDNKFSKECSSIFIEMMDWVQQQIGEEQQGKLICPTPNCG